VIADFTVEAEDDLTEALETLMDIDEDADAGLERAVTWYGQLEGRLEELRVNPRAYRERPEARGARCCFVGDYAVYYRIVDTGILVVRIRPGGEDHRQHLLHV
jgi:plasmid stabilization system protein ParE